MKEAEFEPGIGPTPSLTLRASMANLVSVRLIDPRDRRTRLVLERTAMVLAKGDGTEADIKVKPFGGGVRIEKPNQLRAEIGEFNFDSIRSQEESDLRIFIHPRQWEPLVQLSWRNLHEDIGILELSPERELKEEFRDALMCDLKPNQYRLSWSRLVVEEQPVRTSSTRSTGSMTARIYSIHEMQIEDIYLITRLIENGAELSDQDLRAAAELDYSQGGKGRANAVLLLDYAQLINDCDALSQLETARHTRVWGHNIESNVLAVLVELDSKKYRKVDGEQFVKLEF